MQRWWFSVLFFFHIESFVCFLEWTYSKSGFNFISWNGKKNNDFSNKIKQQHYANKQQESQSPNSSHSTPENLEPTQKQFCQDEKSLKDLILLKINPKTEDFVPNKFSSS